MSVLGHRQNLTGQKLTKQKLTGQTLNGQKLTDSLKNGQMLNNPVFVCVMLETQNPSWYMTLTMDLMHRVKWQY